jgi:hypothetical protein
LYLWAMLLPSAGCQIYKEKHWKKYLLGINTGFPIKKIF